MFERIREALQLLGGSEMAELGAVPLFLVLLISLLASLFVAYLYQTFYAARATGSQVHHAFPLMGVSITAIFVAVQFSLPLSLGLLGALSIVRFRTPIKEPEEIGFILLVIASALAAATFNITFLGLLLAVAVGALLILKGVPTFLRRDTHDGMLLLSLPAGTTARQLQEVMTFLGERVPSAVVGSVAESAEELTVLTRFRSLEPAALPELYAAIKEMAPDARPTFAFDRPGDV